MPVEDVNIPDPFAPPRVSVVMANHNGGSFLAHAITSVLAQRSVDLELLVIDDASNDGSIAVMQSIARHDARVRVFLSSQNLGPAAARNIAIDNATGTWIAIVDSDDLLHPDRLARLIKAAEADGADIAADDLLQFNEGGHGRPLAMLNIPAPCWIDLPAYIRSNALFARGPAYGYLKPIFRAQAVFAHGLRYDSTLRIGEDYDLVLRAMLEGASLRIYPQLTYFYRKHAASLSHRLPEAALHAMLLADGKITPRDAAIARALHFRRASIGRALAFTHLIDALKHRDAITALRVAMRHPSAATLLTLPLGAALRRLEPRKPAYAANNRNICLISRQRIIGNTNGSSAYLLDLCKTMVAQGWRVHLLCPSPTLFGRWPVLALQPEMAVFTSLRVRGGIRIANLIVARDPRIALSACATILRRLARRPRDTEKRAPYAVAAPLLRDDQLYLAHHARKWADIIIADYAFLTDAFPYALRPDAPKAVIMHDLFSSRTEQFARACATDSVAALSPKAEYALLDQASTIIAIQHDEASLVRTHLPGKKVLVVPISQHVAHRAQPGAGATLLFVGGNTAPNIIGLNAFLDEVWPRILKQFAGATLIIAGDVGRSVKAAPRTHRLGRVPHLAPLYRDAALVISPLPMGSGLKIKLVEAMAHGKAIVASAASLQGLPSHSQDAVIQAETPEAVLNAIVRLLGDPASRDLLGFKALRVAGQLFSREVAHRELVGWLKEAVLF